MTFVQLLWPLLSQSALRDLYCRTSKLIYLRIWIAINLPIGRIDLLMMRSQLHFTRPWHLEQPDSYVRMLFIDFSSAFNTVIPHKLVCKLSDLGIDAALCAWIMDFLTNRPQNVKIGDCISSTIIMNTGMPQGCVLSPVLFTLFTHDCAVIHPSNAIVSSLMIPLLWASSQKWRNGLQRGGAAYCPVVWGP